MTVKTMSPQGIATRQTLLDTARGEFGTQGYAGASLDEICSAAGLTKGALYHHFRNKEDLFRVVYETVKQDLSRAVAQAQMPPDPWESLLDGARTWIEVHTEPAILRFLLDARAVLSSEAWHEVDRKWGTVIVRAALRRAMNHGVIAALPLVPLASIVAGTYTEACLLVAHAEGSDVARKEAILIVERLLEGLRTR
jgi:AcrR family transcriptional regulator